VLLVIKPVARVSTHDATHLDELGFVVRVISCITSPSDESPAVPYLAKYVMYVQLKVATQVCSALEHSPTLDRVLHLAADVEELLTAVTEGSQPH